MADPRLEQERILQRLQRILDVVSSWADPMPGARAPHGDAGGVVSTAGAVNDAGADAADGLAAHAPAGASPTRPASVGPARPATDSDGDGDTLRGPAGPAGKGRRHARPTEPIWHALSGQDAGPDAGQGAGQHPGLPATLTGLPGAGRGEPARAGSLATHGDAPGTHAGEAATAARLDATSTAGSDDRPGTSLGRLAAGTIPAAGTDRSSGGSAWPTGSPAAAVPARDAIVQEPLLGQETPPLFGRATSQVRARTGGDTGPLTTQTPGPGRAGVSALPSDHASGNAPGGAAGSASADAAGAPWRATALPGEPATIPGHSSARTGAAPGSLLRPPDLLAADERTPVWPEPAPASAMLLPDGPGAQLAPPRPDQNAAGTVEGAFAHSELEDQLADVLERAALEAGVDLS